MQGHTHGATARTLVVNFNSPELNQLADALTQAGQLSQLVRPYLNKGRSWERAISRLPLAGAVYNATFGRRCVASAELARLTVEAGIAADVCAAAMGHISVLPAHWRHLAKNRLYMRVREAVAKTAAQRVGLGDIDAVIAYEGFALPAFEALQQRAPTAPKLLNYPVAHHRQRRKRRLDEIEREPAFAITWPDFDDWDHGHEARLDAEIAQADAVLVGSTYAADSFIAEGIARSKMQVIPYGVDLATFTPPDRPRPADGVLRVIYAGQLTQRKGLSYLLRGYQGFAAAQAQRVSQLTLVGSPVGSLVPLLPYADLYEHVAHQTRPALAQRYRESDVFLFPTLVEGMPLVVLEAMACGLPVIVTANGPADIVRDGIDGFVIPERDDEAIADRLDRLQRDPDLRIAMGCAAAARAREFSWAVYRSRAVGLLQQLVHA
ncbi:MAG: glycosyltransferase family 4 protein [Leptothrix sp. (in: b-proteobacteria)]